MMAHLLKVPVRGVHEQVQEWAKLATMMALTGIEVNTLSHGALKMIGALSPLLSPMLVSMHSCSLGDIKVIAHHRVLSKLILAQL